MKRLILLFLLFVAVIGILSWLAGFVILFFWWTLEKPITHPWIGLALLVVGLILITTVGFFHKTTSEEQEELPQAQAKEPQSHASYKIIRQLFTLANEIVESFERLMERWFWGWGTNLKWLYTIFLLLAVTLLFRYLVPFWNWVDGKLVLALFFLLTFYSFGVLEGIGSKVRKALRNIKD